MIRLAINGATAKNNHTVNGIQALGGVFQTRIMGKRNLSNRDFPVLIPGASKCVQRVISLRNMEMRYVGGGKRCFAMSQGQCNDIITCALPELRSLQLCSLVDGDQELEASYVTMVCAFLFN